MIKDFTFMSGKQKASFFRKKQAVARFKERNRLLLGLKALLLGKF